MFSVLCGGNAVHALECARKMETVVHSDHITDFVDCAVAELKQTRGLGVADVQQILIRRAARLRLEVPQKHIFRKPRDVREHRKIDLLVRVGADEIAGVDDPAVTVDFRKSLFRKLGDRGGQQGQRKQFAACRRTVLLRETLVQFLQNPGDASRFCKLDSVQQMRPAA